MPFLPWHLSPVYQIPAVCLLWARLYCPPLVGAPVFLYLVPKGQRDLLQKQEPLESSQRPGLCNCPSAS